MLPQTSTIGFSTSSSTLTLGYSTTHLELLKYPMNIPLIVLCTVYVMYMYIYIYVYPINNISQLLSQNYVLHFISTSVMFSLISYIYMYVYIYMYISQLMYRICYTINIYSSPLVPAGPRQLEAELPSDSNGWATPLQWGVQCWRSLPEHTMNCLGFNLSLMNVNSGKWMIIDDNRWVLPMIMWLGKYVELIC